MGYSWTFHLTLIKIADLSWRCLRFFISSLWRYPPNKTPCHHLAGVLFFYALFYFVFIHAYYSFLRFCSHYFHSCGSAPTCPFRQLRWHFSQGKASHSLLQRRFAPRKVVRLPPDKRGRLALPILFSKTDETFFGNAIHSCRHSWAADRTGIMTGEKTSCDS